MKFDQYKLRVESLNKMFENFLKMENSSEKDEFQAKISHETKMLSPVYRYMDFDKFFHLISTGTLFFCSMNALEDPKEGREWTPNDLFCAKIFKNEEILAKIANETKERQLRCVSSWYLPKNLQTECYSMWKIYLNNKNGVCIQTTVENLHNSMQRPNIIFNEVEYFEKYDRKILGRNKYFTKNIAYKYESEYRALLQIELSESSDLAEDLSGLAMDRGIYVPVNLEKLIEKVIVSPFASHWFVQNVDEAMQKYGLKNVQMNRSQLLRKMELPPPINRSLFS